MTKSIKNSITENQNKIRVKVSYPDGKNEHETTIGELRERFKAEKKEWLEQFINSILRYGEGFSRFGKYTRLYN